MSGVDVEAVVIGAGVVGLAIARALAKNGREVVVLEAERGVGLGTSSRNSEVIHAGLYYPTGSLKARCCVEGRTALYAFCDTYGVPHRRCGKIIVAVSDEQVARLDAVRAQAEANGVGDLAWLDCIAIERLEPALRGTAALLSPSTGIIDSHAFMLALQGDLEAHGGQVALRSPLVGARCAPDGLALDVGGDSAMAITARRVILAAGLAGSEVARMFEGLAPESIPRTHFAKGSYFELGRRAPFSRLIYPLPEPGGIGVHLTLDMGGRARFGPDVEWLDVTTSDAIDYSVDASRASRFGAAIRSWWPDLDDGDLVPGYAGVRPKLSRQGEPDCDFLVQTESHHAIRGLVALYGIESPGLTSSLALARHVAALM